jgi:hypothetical protein
MRDLIHSQAFWALILPKAWEVAIVLVVVWVSRKIKGIREELRAIRTHLGIEKDAQR